MITGEGQGKYKARETSNRGASCTSVSKFWSSFVRKVGETVLQGHLFRPPFEICASINKNTQRHIPSMGKQKDFIVGTGKQYRICYLLPISFISIVLFSQSMAVVGKCCITTSRNSSIPSLSLSLWREKLWVSRNITRFRWLVTLFHFIYLFINFSLFLYFLFLWMAYIQTPLNSVVTSLRSFPSSINSESLVIIWTRSKHCEWRLWFLFTASLPLTQNPL